MAFVFLAPPGWMRVLGRIDAGSTFLAALRPDDDGGATITSSPRGDPIPA